MRITTVSHYFLGTSNKLLSRNYLYIQDRYVDHVYNDIAEHFDHTRFARWPKVKSFLNQLEKGSIVYDLGCGNGKYMDQKDLYFLGIDRSQKLLQITKEKHLAYQLIASDTVNLPLRSCSCDSVLSIAVLHHISSRQLRYQALREMVRILKPKGRGLIYVWCLQQKLKNKQKLDSFLAEKIEDYSEEQDIFVSWHLQQRFLKDNNQYERVQEKRSFLVRRFYHLFRKEELEKMVSSIQNAKIIESFYDKENWCLSFVKE